MDPFLRRMSFLMVILVLAGCGQRRADAPEGRPYPVTLEQGVLPAPLAAHPTRPSSRTGCAESSSRSSGGSFWSGSCNLNGSSGQDALVVVAAVVAVVIVVAVVVTVVDAAVAAPEPMAVSYYLTLSGDGVPLAVVTISDTNKIYLDDAQHAAVVRGAYTRAVIRAAAWEGTRGAPTQVVQVSVQRGCITIAPAADQSTQ